MEAKVSLCGWGLKECLTQGKAIVARRIVGMDETAGERMDRENSQGSRLTGKVHQSTTTEGALRTP